MIWQLVHSVSSTDDLISIPHSFTDTLIIVEAISESAKDSWNEAGFLYQLKDIPGVGITRSPYYKRIYLEKQEVKFERLTPIPYTLEFVPRKWISDITLNIWENTMALYPINPPDPTTANQTSTANTTTVAVSTSVTKVLSANTARKGASFYNPDSSKYVYLDVVNTVSATSAKFAVPPGNSLVLDINWVGDLYAVIKSSSINLSVTEYL